MTTNKLAIIGGSGLYDVEEFKDRELLDINTSWGKPSDQILKTNYNNKEVYFLPRHGRGHFISPSNINFRANIDALKQLGVTDIVSVSAVGSLKEDLPPGKFVIVDQFIDRTFARTKTFFDDEIVAHVSMAHPTSNGLMNACEDAIKKSNIDYQRNGTYVVMEGPQFSTLAESNLYRSWKADVIGMTNMPEAKLAREAEIKYASVFDQIGKNLIKGISPTIKQLYYASNIVKDKIIKELKPISTKTDISKVRIDELVMRKMFEWDSTAKILSPKERAYLADFAWGLKKLNSFHEKNVKRHLETLLKKGFKIY